MLDVITDFWKPVKKAGNQDKPDVDRLQVGSTVAFGFVPQTLLSGRKLKVTAVNTYQFDGEKMTSFVLMQDRDDSLSMIVANADGERYLAISRRIPFTDRMKMFDPLEIEAIIEQADMLKLTVRDIDTAWKHWIMPNYKKEIAGARGSIVRGDFRAQPVPASALTQMFDYTLLTSDNNEYAIEVEKYADGRVELYATIYRRLTDITEIEHPQTTEPRLNLSSPVLEVVKPETGVNEPVETRTAPMLEESANPVLAAAERPAPAEEKTLLPSEKPVSALNWNLDEPELEELEDMVMPAIAPVPVPPAPEAAAAAEEKPAYKPMPFNQPAEKPTTPQTKTETDFMQYVPSQPSSAPLNGSAADNKYGESKLPPAPASLRTEVKSSPRGGEVENDAIECDLRVANKIIEEAIRNEMRLSDVVRRIIALPVANPESVHIPVMLTDSDFQLLAIRYGIPASDRTSIKTRIIEEMNDFSGNGSKK